MLQISDLVSLLAEPGVALSASRFSAWLPWRMQHRQEVMAASTEPQHPTSTALVPAGRPATPRILGEMFSHHARAAGC